MLVFRSGAGAVCRLYPDISPALASRSAPAIPPRPGRDIMKAILVAAAFVFAATAAQADSCKASSAKLSGAAKASHMKKCEGDAKAACDKQAMDKKLSGAAKNAFTKKCVTDTVG